MTAFGKLSKLEFSLDAKNAPWMFVEMLKVLWLLSCLHHHDPSALRAGTHGALQRSHSPGAVHLQCSFWLCLQNCPVFACSSINSNACLHRYAVYLLVLGLIQSLQGWWWGSSASTDVCTRTGSQLQGVLVLFHFPRQDLRLLPESGHIYLQGYSNANRSLLKREEGASQKRKKKHFKMKASNNLSARTFGKNKHFFLPELLISTGSNALEAYFLHCLKEIIHQENFGKARHCLKQNIFSR